MAISFAWLDALRQSITRPAQAVARQKPLSVGIGYCPGCAQLRVTNSLSCSYCGNTEPVAANA
jgi:hypothetical protein